MKKTYKQNMFKINFQLYGIDEIEPWGIEEECSLHWFGLTDGLLWINVGDQTLYEYTDEAREYFGKGNRYNDYYLSRFLEDISEICKDIGESIPEELYLLIDDQALFLTQLDYYANMLFQDIEDDMNCEIITEKFDKLFGWSALRCVDSSHLTCGPSIWFFRHKDKIKIVWSSSTSSEIEIKNSWTAPSGSVELSYDMFVNAVFAFFDAFFVAMDKQVENALKKDWGKTELDKEQLVEEHIRRKETFYKDLAFLKKPEAHTDWEEVLYFYKKMKDDLGMV